MQIVLVTFLLLMCHIVIPQFYGRSRDIMCEGARARCEACVCVCLSEGRFVCPLLRGPLTKGLKAAVVPLKQDTVVSDRV